MSAPFFIFEVTQRCNNKCLYCYNVWHEGGYPRGELSLAQIDTLFENLNRQTRVHAVTLAGGEPLMRADILDVAALLKTKNIKTGIVSNGTLLDQAMLQRLIDSGVSYFEISLPCLNEDLFATLCASSGLETVRKAILYIKEKNIALTVAFIITKINMNEIEDVIDVSYAFGADSVALNRFVPTGLGRANGNELSVTNDELSQVLSRANKKAQELNYRVRVTVPVEHCVFDQGKYTFLKFGGCGCGDDKWSIDSLGNLRTCEQNKQVLGSLFTHSFAKLSAAATVKEFREKNARIECGVCAYYHNHCGGGCRFLGN